MLALLVELHSYKYSSTLFNEIGNEEAITSVTIDKSLLLLIKLIELLLRYGISLIALSSSFNSFFIITFSSSTSRLISSISSTILSNTSSVLSLFKYSNTLALFSPLITILVLPLGNSTFFIILEITPNIGKSLLLELSYTNIILLL